MTTIYYEADAKPGVLSDESIAVVQRHRQSGTLMDEAQKISEPVLEDLPRLAKGPIAERWFTGTSLDRTLRLWRNREALLQILDQLDILPHGPLLGFAAQARPGIIFGAAFYICKTGPLTCDIPFRRLFV